MKYYRIDDYTDGQIGNILGFATSMASAVNLIQSSAFESFILEPTKKISEGEKYFQITEFEGIDKNYNDIFVYAGGIETDLAYNEIMEIWESAPSESLKDHYFKPVK